MSETSPSGPAYGPSPVIRRITFAPVSSIVRDGLDSDNWPCTWGDDDVMYTSYGDGRGFAFPKVEPKLSMGFAKIIGGPEGFRGENLRTESGERTGNGPEGPKVSGILMVAGVLYALARNADNSQLLWSEDHGRTWEWGFRFTESFSCPTFVNFGRNYAGARDRYVYLCSPDGASAYESYDQVVMARVPQDRIRERAAYEFFVGLDARGAAHWSADIGRRGPILCYPGHCQRIEAVYHPLLERYLLPLSYHHEGGWGIYDAPAPWGPWTVAFHTEYWGLGNTHAYRLPSKWIGPDPATMYLVFSGREFEGVEYDAFCVRKIALETA